MENYNEKVKNAVPLITTIVIVAVVIGVIYFVSKAGGRLLDAFGLGDKGRTQGENLKINLERVNTIADAENSKGALSPWSGAGFISAIKKGTNYRLFKVAETEKLVSQIWDSVGIVYDSPEKAAAAIKTCSTQSQVAWLCYNFAKKYNRDMLSFFKKHYDTKQQIEIFADILLYVKSLPKYM